MVTNEGTYQFKIENFIYNLEEDALTTSTKAETCANDEFHNRIHSGIWKIFKNPSKGKKRNWKIIQVLHFFNEIWRPD